MNTELIERWQAAERALGRPGEVEAAAEGLPERLGWLLRGLAALEDGSCEGIRELAERARAAGQKELAAVLETALADPEELDPTALRRRAKKSGLGAGMGLPFLDLLRLLAARLAKTRTTKSPALRASERQRPMLRAVNRALSSSSEVIHLERYVRPISPRAEQVIVLARYVEHCNRFKFARRFMTRNFSELLLDLSPAGWSSDSGGVEDWLSGGEWVADALDTRMSAAARRRLLARMLAALHRRLSRGEVFGLWAPASAASELAGGLPGLRSLQRLLRVLRLKLEWADPGRLPPEPLLEALLARHPEAAAFIGRDILKFKITAPSLIPAGLTAAAQGDLNEAAAYIEELADPPEGDPLSSLEFSRILSKAHIDPWHRSWFQVLYELELDQLDRVLAALPGLVAEAPQLAPLSSAMSRALDSISPRRQRSRAVMRAVHRFVEALVARGRERGFGLGEWEDFLLGGLGELPWPAVAKPVALALAERSPDGESPRRQIAILAAAKRAGLDERCAAIVRQLGRSLVRAGDPVAATRRALMWVGVVGGIHHLDLLPELAPLERFLVKRGREGLCDAIAELGEEDASSLALICWWGRHRDALGDAPDVLREWVLMDILGPIVDVASAEMRETLWEAIDAIFQGPEIGVSETHKQLVGVLRGLLMELEASLFTGDGLFS